MRGKKRSSSACDINTFSSGLKYTEEKEVGRGVDDEFDERLLGEPAPVARRGDHVDETEDGELDGNLERLDQLAQHGSAAEAGQALVPDGPQQLLHVGVCYEL